MWDVHRISAEARDHTEKSQNSAIPAEPSLVRLVQGGLQVDLRSLERIRKWHLGMMQHRFHLWLATLVARAQYRSKLFQKLRLELRIVNHRICCLQDFKRCNEGGFADIADPMELDFRREESLDAIAV
jgi:hypothetical protein